MSYRKYPDLDEQVFWEKLSNGLTVAVVPRRGFTRKLAYFVTDFGAIHTQFALDGQQHQVPAGVAHYLEHKMFDMPDGEVTEKFAALGGNVNAFTGYDMTAYYVSCTDFFEENLRLLLQFVSTPYFTEEGVEKERGIIGQEIDMTADTPESRVFENLAAAMYREHPVVTPILGTRESIAQITPEILQLCHRAFYTPANMMLCVVGDVEPEAICALATDVLGQEYRPAGEKKTQWPEEMTCPQPEISQTMEVAMPMFQLSFKAEPADRGEEAVHEEIVADLAAEALFGESSRLYLRLYEEGVIDASFGGGFDTLEGAALLVASGDSYAPEKIREAILEEAERIVREGVSQQDFARMKRSAMGRRIKGLDSFDSLCFRLCAYYFSQFDYFDFPRIYRGVQRQELQTFLARVVTRERCCLSVIQPVNQEEML